MFQRLLSTITWHLCKESVFAVLALLFQDLCNSTGHALNQLLGQILTDSNPFFHNNFLEFVRISGFLFVHPPLEDWPQVLNGIKIWGVSWTWTQNIDVLFPEPLSYHFCLMARCSIMLKKALFVTKLFLDGWEKLLLEDVLVPFFIHGCVLPLAEKQPHTWMVSGCFDFSPVLSSPIPVPFVEYQSVPDVFPGEKWLLCCPSWHQAILQKSSPHCVCRCTHTYLLPFLSKLCTGGALIPQLNQL